MHVTQDIIRIFLNLIKI